MMTENQKITAKKTSATKGKNTWLKDTVGIIVLAVVLALLFKAFIFDSRVVPSTSMLPTIEIGDRIIVSKLSYLGSKEPQRGDIVVFTPPEELNEKYDLVKRVIGLPGDTLEVKDGLVYINGVALEEDYILEAPDYSYGPVTIPQGQYFMLGDNRNNSKDSHMWNYPFIDREAIIGKAIFCYWPISRIGVLR